MYNAIAARVNSLAAMTDYHMVLSLKIVKRMKRYGLVFMLLCLSAAAFAGVDVKTYIPQRAPLYTLTIASEQAQYFPELQEPNYLFGLIEQESCITLTHSRCFNPYSELKTSREQGVGLGQITRAYSANGIVRFDSLRDLRAKHMNELHEWNWDNAKDRVDLQIRALLLMSRDNYKSLYRVKDPAERLKMTDAAYNAGLGRINKDRTKCSLKEWCDPQIWEDNVELTCTASQTPIRMYGNKSPCRINREHVYNVFELRMPKYKQFYRDKTPPLVPPKVVIEDKKIPNYWDRITKHIR